jgi:hypothetical protein
MEFETGKGMSMVKLLEVHDEGQLAFVKSLLDGNGIAYFVQNEYFGSLYPGSASPLNARIVMVPEPELGRAETLLQQLENEMPESNAG